MWAGKFFATSGKKIMSRKGKTPIAVPKDLKINITSDEVQIEGSKGKLSMKIPYGIKVEKKDEELVVTRVSDTKQNRANHGTIRSCVANIIQGVTQGHRRDLEIHGIGFRAAQEAKKVVFNLGFSHPVVFDIPEDVAVTVPTLTSITVEGIDNVRVGQVAALIRALKPAEPYKGKGIRYVGEVIRRKQGKSVAK